MTREISSHAARAVPLPTSRMAITAPPTPAISTDARLRSGPVGWTESIRRPGSNGGASENEWNSRVRDRPGSQNETAGLRNRSLRRSQAAGRWSGHAAKLKELFADFPVLVFQQQVD